LIFQLKKLVKNKFKLILTLNGTITKKVMKHFIESFFDDKGDKKFKLWSKIQEEREVP
jgi:hypothetical protein